MAAVTLLQARSLTRHYGGLQAINNVNFNLISGEIHALIGPNGAGKTTFVGLLCGRVPVQSGTIDFGGEDITHLSPQARARRGIAYTFQITSIFERLSVFDNVALAVQQQGPKDLRRATFAGLDRVGLAGRGGQIAGTLAYGHQRLLEIAMGLALQPRLLILDEPTQGLANSEIEVFKTLIQGLVPERTVLLIEHNMAVVMELADRITVLNYGSVLAEGSPAEIQANSAVQAAYLGVDNAAH